MICPYYVVFSIVPVRGFFRYGALTSLLSSPLESAPSFLRPTKSLMPWSRRPPFSPTDHVGISMSTIKDDGDTMPHPLSSQENFAASTNPSDDECKASILSRIAFRRAKPVVVALGHVGSRRVLHVTQGQRTH